MEEKTARWAVRGYGLLLLLGGLLLFVALNSVVTVGTVPPAAEPERSSGEAMDVVALGIALAGLLVLFRLRWMRIVGGVALGIACIALLWSGLSEASNSLGQRIPAGEGVEAQVAEGVVISWPGFLAELLGYVAAALIAGFGCSLFFFRDEIRLQFRGES